MFNCTCDYVLLTLTFASEKSSVGCDATIDNTVPSFCLCFPFSLKIRKYETLTVAWEEVKGINIIDPEKGRLLYNLPTVFNL